ncbi:ATP-dependent RNA helicase RhlE [Salinivirga cyanobacteriivorans]|uniref:ATP-dependent RNA helicase RhlE n=1 Tax=Salinivirga cyanobacteriivorans TaxID=1307839 RepID=A0A0S2I1X7_9BACT|nr:DEAD/DEAH box helicase [Salinivirga cyanobacteriivorans]ALO16239.1 ATP-dependent RNA helicase RhlE [Salinivirga cyanobacteriivorans]
MKFEAFQLNEQLLEAISYMGFEEASPIQQLAIPPILEGKDLIACAQTGTGKTAAFILPVINQTIALESEGVHTLILVPTRELAVQIDQEIQGIGYFANVDTIAIYGGGNGTDWDLEKKALTKGSGIVVATPGRLLAHLKLGYVNFSQVKNLILDEADRMLDIGFFDDIVKIISHLPEKRQSLMFSATMPGKVRQLANKILHKPLEVNTEISKPAEGVLQGTYLVYDKQKLPLLISLIADNPEYESILIFTSTKKNVNTIVNQLKKKESSTEGISSDLEQDERENVLLRFKSKKTRILVATDVLSRGIDIKDIHLVVNYDVPGDAEDYVHRVGRTARAKSTGVALTLINEQDMYKFHRIEQLIERELIRIPLPKELGDGPQWSPKPDKKYRKKRPSGRKRGNQNQKRRKK